MTIVIMRSMADILSSHWSSWAFLMCSPSFICTPKRNLLLSFLASWASLGLKSTPSFRWKRLIFTMSLTLKFTMLPTFILWGSCTFNSRLSWTHPKWVIIVHRNISSGTLISKDLVLVWRRETWLVNGVKIVILFLLYSWVINIRFFMA